MYNADKNRIKMSNQSVKVSDADSVSSACFRILLCSLRVVEFAFRVLYAFVLVKAIVIVHVFKF